ncbi:MAG: hypothetical protein ICV78_21935 [Tolypothrix sp. Co-bin9]|nr:hypothetical protein [Tolypothrix sp. Co-bin9]
MFTELQIKLYKANLKKNLRPLDRRGTSEVKYQTYQIIGYAELEDKAPNTRRSGCFVRRIFWLAKHDRFYQPDGVYKQGCPTEAIEPLTVFPKVLGQITTKAWSKAKHGYKAPSFFVRLNWGGVQAPS